MYSYVCLRESQLTASMDKERATRFISMTIGKDGRLDWLICLPWAELPHGFTSMLLHLTRAINTPIAKHTIFNAMNTICNEHNTNMIRLTRVEMRIFSVFFHKTLIRLQRGPQLRCKLRSQALLEGFKCDIPLSKQV